MTSTPGTTGSHLARRLTTSDAVVLGVGSMLGAGVFAAFTPAAEAAGPGLLVALVLAAALAYCNAMSSARLAAVYPMSGGTYVYGRERLGEGWGYLAGWSFVVGKTASCAAIALTVGHYSGLGHPQLLAAAVVLAITALNYFGVQRSALATRVIVGFVVAVLGVAVGTALSSGEADAGDLALPPGLSLGEVLEATGFLFFAFAGYARLATLGEEVRDPARVIPRAIRVALLIVLAVYALVAISLTSVLGAGEVASTPAPVAALADRSGAFWLEPMIRAAAVLAAIGALLALLLGVSRTVFAMARDAALPRLLNRVHPRYGVPHRAEVAVGLVVAVLALTLDLRGAIGFSSFLVLVYYAIANAAALTLERSRGRWMLPVCGVLGCVLVALALPISAVLPGAAVLLVGLLAWLLSRRVDQARR